MDNKIIKFTKALKLKNPIIGINFTNKIPNNMKYFKDTACTALARAFIKKEIVVIGSKKYSQLCSGADYFLKLKNTKDEDAVNVYVDEEHVFKDQEICKEFLKSLPKFPDKLKSKSIIIKPFDVDDKPLVIVLLVNPAQAGRIIGLLNYSEYKEVKIFPNQSTCLSIFAPIITGIPHINFIDYFDRYFQGKVSGKYIWPEDKMIISLQFRHFKAIINNLNKSPQGAFKRKIINPKIVDKMEV